MHILLPASQNNLSIRKGQALIGVLIAIAVFAILSHTVFTLISASYNLVAFNRARITAKHLAQEKMETIRNFAYDDVGTVGGIPSGTIEQEEVVDLNGQDFTIKTSIIYINDPFDGSEADDTDYKRVRIEVSWGGIAQSRRNPVLFISDVAPQLATTGEGGTLKVLVLDANGNRLAGAQVTIVANSTTPPVNTTQTTDANGEVTLPGATPCASCYQITVTKAGYSTDRTYSTSEVANPSKPYASVLDGQLTQASFTIDRTGTLTISSVDSRENSFAALGGVNFRIKGDKQIGTDAVGLPVYKYDKSFTTNSTGNYSISNVEWDIYQILMPEGTVHDIAGSSPLLPINLTPGSAISMTFSVKPHTDHNLLAIIKDPSQNLLGDVYLRLYDDSGFNEATLSGKAGDPDFGQNFFANLSDLVIYHLEATSSGYLNKTQDVYVSGYTVDEMTLTPE